MQPEHRMAVERKVFEGHPNFLKDMLYEVLEHEVHAITK